MLRMAEHSGPARDWAVTNAEQDGRSEGAGRTTLLPDDQGRKYLRLSAPLDGLMFGTLRSCRRSRPMHDAFHFGEGLLAPRALLLQRVLGAGNAALAHVLPDEVPMPAVL